MNLLHQRWEKLQMSAGLLYHGGVPGVLRELHVATFKLTLTMAIFISLCASFSHAQFVTRKGDTTKSLKELKKKKILNLLPIILSFIL